MKMVGAILNALSQCDERMIGSGLRTKYQFQDVKEGFLEYMARLFGRNSEAVVVEYYGKTQIRNNWGNIKGTIDEVP